MRAGASGTRRRRANTIDLTAMTYASTLQRSDDSERARIFDRLAVGEWLFLHFVLVVASYAVSLQPPLQSLAWYLVYLLALALCVLRYGAVFAGLWVALPLLALPAMAALSYFWSDAPGQTLRTAVQLAMTVLISVYLGSRFSLFDLARALFAVLVLTALASLAAILLKLGFAFDENGVARGIFPHKNILGGRMVLLLLCGLLLFARGWRRFAVVVASLLAVVLLAFSQSGTAIVMLAGLAILAPVVLTRRGSASWRLPAFIVACMVVSLAAWLVLAYDLDPVGLALEALGKERTLSGRSLLWEFAVGLIEHRPWLGGGFDAFWHGGDGSASGYVQHVVRQEIMNFHNSYLDIAVQLGFIGLALAVAFLLCFAWRALALLQSSASPLAALPALFLAFVVAYSLSEYALFRQHSLIQVLLGALYVSAALALPGPRRRQASPASLAQT